MDSSDKLKVLGETMKKNAVGSSKYNKAMKELDTILGMPAEIKGLKEIVNDNEEQEQAD